MSDNLLLALLYFWVASVGAVILTMTHTIVPPPWAFSLLTGYAIGTTPMMILVLLDLYRHGLENDR